MKQMSGSRAKFSLNEFLIKRGTGIVMVTILLLLGLRNSLFIVSGNLMDVLGQSGILSMIALGQTVILISGGFDMGAGATVQLTCNLAAGLIISGMTPMLTLPIGLLVGLLIGLFNAFLVLVVRISSFVATLGTMFVLQGLTNFYNNGQVLPIKTVPGFTFLGQGRVGPLPFLFLVVVILCALIHYFLKHTRTGLRMYAIGENSTAAILQGVSRGKYMLIGYLFSGAVLGITGVMQCSYNYGASAVVNSMDYIIQALAAAYLGSTFSRTGELSVIGTIISAVFITALSNALIINGISDRQITGILGFILILSILLTVMHKREIGQVTMF